MKKETRLRFLPVHSVKFFIYFSSKRLLLSMKGTKDCLYCRESCKYDSTVKKKDL